MTTTAFDGDVLATDLRRRDRRQKSSEGEVDQACLAIKR